MSHLPELDAYNLPHKVMMEYYRNRHDRRNRKVVLLDAYEIRAKQRQVQDFKYKLRKTTDTYARPSIFGIDIIDTWLKQCALYRIYIQRGVAPFSGGKSWSETHRRTIECIRGTRMNILKGLPGTSPYPFRVDASTKFVPPDSIDRRTCCLTKAVELGYLPQRVEIHANFGGVEWMKRVIVEKLRPQSMWSIEREEDDDDDDDHNKLKKTIIYFTENESAGDAASLLWQQWEIDRIKMQLADIKPKRQIAA
jgi:hypothetical protein